MMTNTWRTKALATLLYLGVLVVMWCALAPVAWGQCVERPADQPGQDMVMVANDTSRVVVQYASAGRLSDGPLLWCPSGTTLMIRGADTVWLDAGRPFRRAMSGGLRLVVLDSTAVAYDRWQEAWAGVFGAPFAESPPIVVVPEPLPQPPTTARDCGLVAPQVVSVTQGAGYVLKSDGRFEVWVGPMCRGVITMRSATRYTAVVWSCESQTWVARTTSYPSRVKAAEAVVGQGTCP